MFHWLKALLGLGNRKPTRQQNKPAPRPDASAANRAVVVPADDIDGMNEGDYHSGIHGYSANTAYPETQYGSGYDSSADWNEGDEH